MNRLEFGNLFKVANVVLTIQHSNAGKERIFSLYKTPSSNSLSHDSTLSSLVTVKTHIKNPLQWQPSEELLEKAKHATTLYNKQHHKKTCTCLLKIAVCLLSGSVCISHSR